MTFLLDIETASDPAPIAQDNFETIDALLGATTRGDADSLLINGATKPASLIGGISWKSGTAPSADVADQVSLWVGDRTAGEAGLRLRSESGILSHFGDRVGLGTLTPLGKLHTVVAGANDILIEDSSASANARIQAIRSTGGQLHVGSLTDDGLIFAALMRLQPTTGKLTIGFPAPDPTLDASNIKAYYLMTNTSGALYNVRFSTEYNPTANSSASGYGQLIEAYSTAGNTRNFTDVNGITGLLSNAYHLGSGTVTAMRGLNTACVATGSTGTVTQGIGLDIRVGATTGMTMTTAIGLKIRAFDATGTLTTRWAIKQEGASDHNTFAGNVLLGSTTLPSSLTKGLVLATGTAATGTVAAGEIAIWFDGTDLRARIGTTNYTFSKT